MSRGRAKPSPPPLHELEAEVMEEVWLSDGEHTVREVLDALNARAERKRAYTTVMTIMSRLHTKGLLEREQRGKAYRYRPVMSRDAYLNARARKEVEVLVADFGDLALAHFARRVGGLDRRRLEKLRRLAEEER